MSFGFGNKKNTSSYRRPSNQSPFGSPMFGSSGKPPTLSQAPSSQKSTPNEKNQIFTFGMSESPTFNFPNMARSKFPSKPKLTSNDNEDTPFSLFNYGSYFLVSASLSAIICILPLFLGLRTTTGSNDEMSDDVIAKLGKKNQISTK